MNSRVFISDDVKYIGFDDEKLTIFESQYPVEGISYNSWVIMDEKIAIMDTVDERGTEAYFKNLENALEGRKPDYLIVQHLEPDHSAGIGKLAEMYPDMKLVGTAACGRMIGQFFDMDFSGRFQAVNEGDTLSLGKHNLQFVFAPMVHWPEVMMSFDVPFGILFSADGFGTFGALANNEEWRKDGGHYYFNIVGKYGAQVQAVLKKAESLEIKMAAPLHGPVLKAEDGGLAEAVGKYKIWSSYEPELKGVFIPYASIHGNTKKAVLEFAKECEEAGMTVKTMDLTEEDVSEAVEQAFLYDRMVIAAATYDGEIFPPMNDLLHHLKIKNFQKRKVGIIENGSWAPVAGKKMKEILESMKDITVVEPIVTIKSVRKPSDDEMFTELLESMKD